MSKWKVEDGRLIGTDVNTWSFLHSERKFPENVGLRVKFRLVEGRAISAMLNRTSEEVKSHVNLATWATYIGMENLKSGRRHRVLNAPALPTWPSFHECINGLPCGPRIILHDWQCCLSATTTRWRIPLVRRSESMSLLEVI